MNKNFEMLDFWTEQGMLRKVISPCERFVLYNYNDACTFSKTWNEYTLNARGTIYNIETGEIVAKAFPKFFNIEELPSEKQKEILNLKSEDFHVTEKVDGSLGILAYYDDKWQLSTRGSFTSDQAIKGLEILKKYDSSKLLKNTTYLVEIIYPENKIIVNYGNEEKLVLIAAYVTNTGAEIPHIHLTEPFPLCKTYRFKCVDDIINAQINLPWTEEGFVVRFGNNERVKFKSREYMKIAKIKANMSPLTFWEKMREGDSIFSEWFHSLPEELRPDANSIYNSLAECFTRVEVEVYQTKSRVFNELFNGHPENTKENKKKLGLFLKDNPQPYGNSLFSIMDGNFEPVRDLIYKEIKPTGNLIKEFE